MKPAESAPLSAIKGTAAPSYDMPVFPCLRGKQAGENRKPFPPALQNEQVTDYSFVTPCTMRPYKCIDFPENAVLLRDNLLSLDVRFQKRGRYQQI